MRKIRKQLSTVICQNHIKLMPILHQNFFLKWAEAIGGGVFNIAKEIIQSKKHPDQAIKIYFSFKKLAKRYGKNRLNQACRRAIGLNCIGFKSIASILDKGLDSQPYLNEVEKPYTPHHENLRGTQYYQKR